MKILKFGGASLKDITSLEKISTIVQKELSQNQNVIIVVSAFYNTTSALENFLLTKLYLSEAKIKKLINNLKNRYVSMLQE